MVDRKVSPKIISFQTAYITNMRTLIPKCISLSYLLKKKLPFSKSEPHTIVAGFWFLAG